MTSPKRVDSEFGIEYICEKSDVEITMTPDQFRNACAEGVAERKPVVFRNLAPTSVHPTWDEHLQHLNLQFNNKDGLSDGRKLQAGHPTSERAINNTMLRGFFYIINMITDQQYFKSMIPFQEFLSEAIGEDKDHPAANMHFLSFVENDAIADPHRDPQHTVYVQNQGSVTWRFYEDISHCHKCNMPNYEGEVSQGDVVFIPQATAHSVDFNGGPRAAIAYRSKSADWAHLPVVEKVQFGFEDNSIYGI